MRRTKVEDGNVIVEFIGITVALLVPLSIIANSSILVANAYLATDVSARTAEPQFQRLDLLRKTSIRETAQ